MSGIAPARYDEFTLDWNSGRSIKAMGRVYGVQHGTIRRTAQRLGLAPRTTKYGGTRERPTCPCCGGDTGGRCGCLRGRVCA